MIKIKCVLTLHQHYTEQHAGRIKGSIHAVIVDSTWESAPNYNNNGDFRGKLATRQGLPVASIASMHLLAYQIEATSPLISGQCVDLSPLSNFKYPRWRPRWLSLSLIFENVHYFNVSCFGSMFFLPIYIHVLRSVDKV